ncbi:hypothetical protein M0811_08853 [Anaeramoeba ignava]|uniref:Uncharacterized protein n=1 Tax=Anaeramoeba ignava TaxID=1746090 RepID=A0A9Q0LI93_ANAIG|nr:hypothetical protein M0811_08853 [Anaeramoeba ignava]
MLKKEQNLIVIINSSLENSPITNLMKEKHFQIKFSNQISADYIFPQAESLSIKIIKFNQSKFDLEKEKEKENFKEFWNKNNLDKFLNIFTNGIILAGISQNSIKMFLKFELILQKKHPIFLFDENDFQDCFKIIFSLLKSRFEMVLSRKHELSEKEFEKEFEKKFDFGKLRKILGRKKTNQNQNQNQNQNLKISDWIILNLKKEKITK